MNRIKISRQWLIALLLLLIHNITLWSQPQTPDSLDVVKSLRVGCHNFDGNYFICQLERFTNYNCELVDCGSTWQECIDALERGDIDLLADVMRTDKQKSQQGQWFPTGSRSVFLVSHFENHSLLPDAFAVQRGHEQVVHQVQEAIAQLVAPRDSVFFNDEEIDFIRAHSQGGQRIMVALDSDCAPYSSYQDGTYQGIVVDYWRYLMRRCGLDYQFYVRDNAVISHEVLNVPGVDLYLCYANSSQQARDEGLLASNCFLHTGMALVTRRDNPPLRVIAVSLTTPVLNNSIPLPEGTKIRHAANCREGVDMVLHGKADGIYLYSSEAQMVLNSSQSSDLMLLPVPGVELTFSIAQRRDADHRLMSVVSKCMRRVSDADVDAIVAKQVSKSVSSFSIPDYLRRHWLLFGTLSGLLLFLAVHLAATYRNRARRIREEARQRIEAAYRTKIEDALAAAKQASMAKTAFLNNMSHDIRTPMNAVVGFTQLALGHLDQPERVEDYLHKIDRSSRHLLDLINNMLDMSRIESGRMCLDEQPMLLTDTLTDLQSLMMPAASDRKITLVCEQLGVTHPEVMCDKLRLNQILVNLAGNAIKFTPQGGTVWICLVEVGEARAGDVAYEFHVRDTGIGMSPEFQSKIFEPFSREHSSTVSKTEGSGLGMAITKSLVDLMGGTISVTSEQGRGTEFIVTLHLRLASSSASMPSGSSASAQASVPASGSIPAPAPEEPDFTNKRLLLVEDNALNQEIATALLEEFGFSIEVAENGQMAVDMISESEPGRYDAVLMDIQMPVMDGYEATRQIRLLSDPQRAHLPILAMTANAFEEDKARALAAGMNGHLSKPINVPELIRMLTSVIA